MEKGEIDWKYFFGTPGDRYYYAEIKGVRVERHVSGNKIKFCVGNMDLAKKKFTNETDLLKSLNN